MNADSHRRPARLVPVASWVAACLALIATSCGMPTDNSPDSIAIEGDLAEVLDPAPATVTTPTTTPELNREMSLYFIEDDLLSRVANPMPLSRAQSLTAVLNRLTEGTLLENHRTAIPDGVTILDTRIDDDRGVATVVLADASLFSREGNERLRAIAQIVFTATATDSRGNGFDVDRVRFEIDGEIRSIPTAGGSDTSEPVGRCDYERLARPVDVRDCPTPTTTTSSTTTTTTTADDVDAVSRRDR